MNSTIYSTKNHGYFANARDDMLAFIPTGVRRILEIGCGTGEFGAAIKRRGDVEIVGVELVNRRPPAPGTIWIKSSQPISNAKTSTCRRNHSIAWFATTFWST